jgi:hypothetical protein
MQRVINALFISAVFIISVSCSVKPDRDIDKAEWIIGLWEHKVADGYQYEEWIKINNCEFSGRGYHVQNNDTTLFETVQLIQRQDSLFYIATVSNQNNKQPIPFLLKTATDTSLLFENREHDFPQTIKYSVFKTDSLQATICGEINGEEREIIIYMRRAK